jgi:hypothetical protein
MNDWSQYVDKVEDYRVQMEEVCICERSEDTVDLW